MPEQRVVRRSSGKPRKIEGSERKAPHRGPSAHKVTRKWPYYRAALIWFAALGLMLIAVASFGYGFWIKENKFIYYSLAIMGLWFFMKIMFFFAAKATTCPLCRACHLGNTRSNKHKNAYKVFPFSYASTAAITAFFRGCIRCMHCGVSFDITKKH